MPARILIAPDKFKGSLTAPQAAEAIAAGVRKSYPHALLDLCPIADGGEGFMATLAAAMKGKWVSCPAVDPLGRAIDSRYVLAETEDGTVAILEMAEASGLWRLAPTERDPLRATTRGTGMQIAHAVAAHSVVRIILGLGGSATNDGGAGMAAALGIDFLDADGHAVNPIPAYLSAVVRVDATRRISLPPVIAACDVDNPLLGARGATAVFSTQKGSTTDSRAVLEAALSHLVEITSAVDAAHTPGAGAAGGLGFGLMHFTGARLTSGFDLLADLLDLETRIKTADLVITGEGSIDHQSLSGKGPVALARLAKRHAVPVAGFCGCTDQAARDSGVFTSLHALADSGLPLETLISQAASLLTETVGNAKLL